MISHRATWNLGLISLLLILLSVVFVAYHSNQKAIRTLLHLVEQHTPLQTRLLQINELLSGADQVFAIYIRRDRVTASDVLTAFRNLMDEASTIDEAFAGENRLFAQDENFIGAIRLYFLYYLEEEVSDPAADTVAASLVEIETRLAALRRRLHEVEMHSPGTAQADEITARTASAARALTAAEEVFKRYIERDRVDLHEVMLPVERSLQLLRVAVVPEGIAEATAALERTQRVLEHYKSALIRYAESEAVAHNGSSKEIEEEVIRAWGDAEIALSEFNGILSDNIQRDQRQTIASEQSRQRIMLGLAGMGFFLALLVSYLLGRSLSLRLEQLVDGSRRIASGELGYRLGSTSNDEFGQVANAFDDMSEELKRKDKELQRSFVQLDDANREISHANTQLESRVAQRTAQLRKALITAQSADRTKDEFIAKVSHEIRTPLSGMLGTAELLLITELSSEQRWLTRALQESSLSLLRIINDILDFSRIKAGKLSLQTVDFELMSVVESSLKAVTSKAHGKGLELACDLSPELPRTLRGDPDRMRQILLNLLDNAVKFTDRGEVVLRVMADGNDGVGGLRFEVNDTGIGIPEDTISKLFDSFVQVDDSSTRRHGGTGLGLAIVKQLVEQMGGEIGVFNRTEGGSTFWINLALPEAQDGERLGPQADPAFARLRILIVDDNATSRTLLARTTSLLGCQTENVANGEKALTLIRQAADAGRPFDIALVDAVMPGMDGITLATRIRADTRNPPALIMLAQTGLPGGAAIRKALGESVSWLNKPVQAQALENSLRKVTEVSAPEPKLVTSAEPLEKVSFGGMCVLLAEDNPVIQKVVYTMLENLGCKADMVDDGRAAQAALENKRYDLVLMDCQMPELDGYQVVAALRRREGEARHTPVVALTASAMDGTRERCLAAGMDDYLAKPVFEKDLISILTHWCHDIGVSQGMTATFNSIPR